MVIERSTRGSVGKSMAGERPDRDDDADPSGSLTTLDDSFDDLLKAAVSPLETLDPILPTEQFVRLPAGAKVSERFVVEWCVAAGGMGDVYRCHDLETRRPAALKVIRQVDDHSRFRREASILSALSHDAIVRYLAHGTTDAGTPFLAMEWLEGEDLAQTLARSALSIADTLTLVRRVCEGLTIAHRHGFVHRDIKPSNLFVCHGQLAKTKVLDFGVAHRGLATQTSTRAGTMLGTVGYMAPEQAWGMPSPDPRDDLFSLGCVMFECLTGRAAFAGENAIAVLEAVLQVEPPDVRRFAPDVPAELAALVQQLLQKDRRSRPSDCAVVVRLLDAIGGNDGSPRGADPSVFKARFGVRVQVRGTELAAAAALVGGSVEPDSIETGAPDRLLVTLKTSFDVTLVDVAQAAVDCALRLHEARPELSIEVSDPAHYDDLDAAAERTVTAQPGELRIGATTAHLYRSRDELAHVSLGAEAAGVRAASFVGRESELTVLNAVLEECREDEVSSAVLILGPVGSGKSRVLSEFLANIPRHDSLQVRMARASRATRNVRFHVLRSLLSPPLAAGDPDEDLAPIFRSQIEAACARGGLILSIDDAHCIDVESMQVLASLVSADAERPLLLLGAARPQLGAELRSHWQSASARSVTLRPLSLRSVERLVRALGFELEPEQVARLSTLTEGNPQLLAACASAILLPDGARIDTAVTLLAERLSDLPASELSVLTAASDADGPFAVAGLAPVIPSHPDIARDLAALGKRGVLVPLQSGISGPEIQFTFAHALVRRAASKLRGRARAAL